MINPIDNPEVIHGQSPSKRIDMGAMDAESIAFMLSQSRDGFYSNKELAPIREYSTNAFDAHIVAGIPERPIEITLPTQMEPELKIRDFGKGLNIEELSDVYFKYWKSTKRNTNDQNGFLGIGSKAAMAYADVYTVVSRCNGEKIIVTGQKNGFADVICHERNTNNEPHGIEVIIPIQQKDIQKFITEALEFFKFWDIKPIFHNIEQETVTAAFNVMNSKPFLSGEGWAIRPAGYGSGQTKAVMAKVAYNIDWDQVQNSLAPEVAQKTNGIFTFLRENLTTLYFNNGTLSFTPNRESLQYNEVTVLALSEKLIAIYDCLLNLITSKISDAPNLWEAKIRYNQIFRKELDGFDKSTLYGGNLSTIENLLKNKIQWNGITIKNGYFEDLEQWDAKEGNVGRGNYSDDDSVPILTTYIKNKNINGSDDISAVRNSYRRRHYGTDSKIICSPKSAIVIQNTDKNFLAKGLARWIFYKSGKDISQVYILNLSNVKVKDEFYKHYDFETIPVTGVSENELLIKAYLKSIRAPRGTGNNGGERASRPLNCPYVSIEDRQDGQYLSSYVGWNHETVNARGVETDNDELYYVVYSKKSFTFNGREISHDNSGEFWQSIYKLSEISNIKLTKVFGIHPKTANSEWFKKSVEEGNWINLSEFVSENIESLPKDIIKKVSAYFECDENRIGIVAASTLLPVLVSEMGLAGKYFKEIADFSNHLDIIKIPRHLSVSGFEHDESYTESFKKINEEMRKKYPLLFKTNLHDYIFNCNPKSSYKINDETANELAQYINLIDCYS